MFGLKCLWLNLGSLLRLVLLLVLLLLLLLCQ